MDLNSIKLSNLEKAMKARSALMFLTSLAFVDCYLILRHGSNLASLSFIWVKANIDLSETILIAAFFTVTFGLLIPGITIIGRIILGTVID